MDFVTCVLSAMIVRICSNPSTGLRCTFNSDPRRYHTYGLLPYTLDGNFGTPHKSLQLARICSNLWTYKFASALGIHATSYLICGYTFADHQLVLQPPLRSMSWYVVNCSFTEASVIIGVDQVSTLLMVVVDEKDAMERVVVISPIVFLAWNVVISTDGFLVWIFGNAKTLYLGQRKNEVIARGVRSLQRH